MALNQNVLNYILVSLIIVVAVHYLFSDNSKLKPIKRIIKVEEDMNEPFDDPTYFSQPVSNSPPSSLRSQDQLSVNPIPFNEDASLDYMTKTLTGNASDCSAPATSRKQFNNDFFSFRDVTCANSSIRYDAVDKVQRLYLEGNTSPARGQQEPLKIKDIFDNATKGPNTYLRQCVRLPDFDNLSSDGYTTSMGENSQKRTSASQQGWSYPNEKVLNGGQIKQGLFASDPHRDYSMPV